MISAIFAAPLGARLEHHVGVAEIHPHGGGGNFGSAEAAEHRRDFGKPGADRAFGVSFISSETSSEMLAGRSGFQGELSVSGSFSRSRFDGSGHHGNGNLVRAANPRHYWKRSTMNQPSWQLPRNVSRCIYLRSDPTRRRWSRGRSTNRCSKPPLTMHAPTAIHETAFAPNKSVNPIAVPNLQVADNAGPCNR